MNVERVGRLRAVKVGGREGRGRNLGSEKEQEIEVCTAQTCTSSDQAKVSFRVH